MNADAWTKILRGSPTPSRSHCPLQIYCSIRTQLASTAHMLYWPWAKASSVCWAGVKLHLVPEDWKRGDDKITYLRNYQIQLKSELQGILWRRKGSRKEGREEGKGREEVATCKYFFWVALANYLNFLSFSLLIWKWQYE